MGRLAELEEWRRHPFLRATFANARIVSDWVSADGRAYVAVMAEEGRMSGHDVVGRELVALGADDAVDALLAHVIDTAEPFGPFDEVEVPEGTLPLLSDEIRAVLGYPENHGEWYYLFTERALPVPEIADTIDRVAPGPDIAADVRALLDVAYPEAWTPPDSPKMVGWWTVRRAGKLVAAIGATQSHPEATPWLCSLSVHPDARGAGLGSALLVTAGNDCLELPMQGPPLVSLGVYATNVQARDLYVHLGWQAGASLTSW